MSNPEMQGTVQNAKNKVPLKGVIVEYDHFKPVITADNGVFVFPAATKKLSVYFPRFWLGDVYSMRKLTFKKKGYNTLISYYSVNNRNKPFFMMKNTAEQDAGANP